MTEQNPGHPVLSKIANAVSISRMAFSLEQFRELLTTVPEERTWKSAIATALFAATDGLDGPLARAWGSTDNGPEIDRLADVSFFGLGETALSLKGEVEPIHPVVDFVREIAVNSMRALAKSNGQPQIKVGMRGKQKTAAKMATLTLARSPLARYRGLVRSSSAVGTALSLASAADYGSQYWRGRTAKQREETDSARNGAARKATESNYLKVARLLNERYPKLKPDHLTRLGELLVGGSDVAALVKPELGFVLGAGPYTVGGLIDGLDGSLARLQGIDSVEGMIKDVSADKRMEIYTAATNSLISGNRGNYVSAYHYALAAMTAPLPALFRSVAESRGYIVNEDAIGSRVTRSIEGGIGLGFNKFRQLSDVNSALMLVGNVITARQRADVALRGEASPYFRGRNDDPEFIQQARMRRNALLPIVAGGLAVGAALIARERRRNTK